MMAKKSVPGVGKCFDHLGGRLAPILFERMVEMGWIRPKEGRKTIFEVTEEGGRGLKEVFDIDASEFDDQCRGMCPSR